MQQTAQPRGIVARLRHNIGPVLPAFLRRAGARVVESLEQRHGSTYNVAGQRVRFVRGSAPAVAVTHSDERTAVDALQLARFAQEIRPGDIVADVGSYRGTYAVVAAACAGPHGQVFAFEPTTANRAVIASNLELNHFTDRVIVEPVAVSDCTGTATFYEWGDATTNSLAATQTQASAVAVRTVTLDDYFRGKTLPRVLKIDIEGAELLALRGAHDILASDARIICELHPYAWAEMGCSGDDLERVLAASGRAPIDLATGQPLTDYRYGAVWLARRD